jgi:diguanylate cyclase (GGDEF)-like protein
VTALCVAVVAAAAAFARADKHRTRVQARFDAAADTHAAGTTAEVVAAVVRQSRDVVRSPQVVLREEPPTSGELGVRLRTSEDERCWLVAAPRPSGDPFSEDDRLALEAMAAVAGESLGRARVVADMAHLAGHDPLTGLANRAVFRREVRAAAEDPDGGVVAVLFCDLDGFKAVNDSLGHDAGDELLVTVARRLAAAVRPGDVVARLGGDEFAVLMRWVGSEQEAAAVSERLVSTLADPVVVRGVRLTVGCSVGVATSAGSPPGTWDSATLLRHSDVAMYAAKAAGKNRAALFDPGMLAGRVERVTLEQQLRHALDHDELVLRYQPVVDLDTGRVDGFEALVRWDHPTRGLLAPADFVPFAEETGVVVELGAWVLEQAHADVVAFADLLGRQLTLGVNVSGCQLADDRLERAVERLAPHPAVHLVLEITEGTIVTALEDAPRLERLRALGADLAVDDFGTGYSSLAYLRDLPVDILKLDRAFVSGVDSDRRVAGLARAIVDMARTLSLVVVVEGIEEQGQLTVLQEMGCRLGQGHHFARPMPADAVLGYLGRNPVAA